VESTLKHQNQVMYSAHFSLSQACRL